MPRRRPVSLALVALLCLAALGPGTSATPAAAPPGAADSTTSGIPWLLMVLAGILIAAFGGILIVRGSRTGATVAGGGPATTGGGATTGCPDGSEPRVTTSGAFEVDLFVLSSAQLNIDGAFMFGAAEGDAAIEGFETATAASDVAVGLIGAVTDPVGSILGSLGVPSFDTVTQAPAAAAQKALNKLNEQLRQKRKIGTWTLTVPKQRFRFSCRVTESCVGGEWVVTAREFHGERIGAPTYVDSAPFELVDVREADRAWTMMSTPFIRQNRVAEKMIASAAGACGG